MGLPFPPVLRIEPASRCNFQCIHCPTGLGLNESLGVMNEDTFEKIFEKIKGYHFRVIVLYHGGEPFLNRHFAEMVERLRPLAGKIKTVSNGSMLNDALIDQILASGLDEIEFSLDGNSPEENDRIRVNSNFAKISASIRKLLELKKARKLEKPLVSISNAQIPADVAQLDSRPETPKYLLDAFGDAVNYKKTWSLIWPGMLSIKNHNKPESNFCDHIISTFTIRWNGDVVPCCYDLTNMMVMGNVLNEDLETVWNNEKYRKLRDDIANFNPPDLCKDCSVLSRKNYMTIADLSK